MPPTHSLPSLSLVPFHEPPWVRAVGDYLRLRQAYDRLCAEEPENDVGRTLIGMDLERARRALEQLEGG